MAKKSKANELKEKLFYDKKTVFTAMTPEELAEALDYAKGYSDYLYNAKTEREAVKTSVSLLKSHGFKEYKFGLKLKKGGKYYYNNRGKSLYVFVIGSESPKEGIRISAAHIDSPRIDLKQHPLCENKGIGYFKTHYYGGIRKYQWPTTPLALHGTVTLTDGKNIDVCIGEDPKDPVFCVTDLLPHLAAKQGADTLASAFSGESLYVLAGSAPYPADGDEKIEDSVKLNIMNTLYEKYGITESDFMSSELCFVPAGKPRDVGFDKWLLGAYGHDDVVCAYPALTALMENTDSVHTTFCILADKEETGSDGVSGMQSQIFTDLVDEIAKGFDCDPAEVRANSMCLSADVTAAFDPCYPDVFEYANSSPIHSGVAIAKYTGSRGKYSTNDASAELVAKVRNILDKAGVLWQTAELGKVDAGGGGTVAKYISLKNIETIDIGVPVLSMHAPFELISKGDLYTAYQAFSAFYK